MTKEEIEEGRISFMDERIAIILEDESFTEQQAESMAITRWLKYKRHNGWAEQDILI